jgi:hypothetical protein
MDGHILSVLYLGACGSLQMKKIKAFSNLNPSLTITYKDLSQISQA